MVLVQKSLVQKKKIDTIETFLREQKILRLATVGDNGKDSSNNSKEEEEVRGNNERSGNNFCIPHVVPVWYLYESGKFYVGTNTETKKAKNLKRKKQNNGNNAVSFCVDVGVNSPDIYGIVGQGKGRLILKKDQVKKIAKKILLKYFKTITNNKSAQELLDDTDCIIEITPEKITEWHY